MHFTLLSVTAHNSVVHLCCKLYYRLSRQNHFYRDKTREDLLAYTKITRDPILITHLDNSVGNIVVGRYLHLAWQKGYVTQHNIIHPPTAIIGLVYYGKSREFKINIKIRISYMLLWCVRVCVPPLSSMCTEQFYTFE